MYGPDVSYSRTGASPPDSGTSRNGTPSTISLREPGNAPRVMDKRHVENGFVHLRLSYAGLLRDEGARIRF